LQWAFWGYWVTGQVVALVPAHRRDCRDIGAVLIIALFFFRQHQVDVAGRLTDRAGACMIDEQAEGRQIVDLCAANRLWFQL
jgi:hypothetical protein